MPDLRHTQVDTELGELMLVARADSLSGLYFPGHWHLPDASAFGVAVDVDNDELLTRARDELERYLEGSRDPFSVPLEVRGDELSERIWTYLQTIPYGTTTTYGAIAEQLGNRHLAQRVGQVVGRNPLSIFIPCHRVVGADGSLTGYAGGLERKHWLLELEEPVEERETRLF